MNASKMNLILRLCKKEKIPLSLPMINYFEELRSGVIPCQFDSKDGCGSRVRQSPNISKEQVKKEHLMGGHWANICTAYAGAKTANDRCVAHDVSSNCCQHQ